MVDTHHDEQPTGRAADGISLQPSFLSTPVMLYIPHLATRTQCYLVARSATTVRVTKASLGVRYNPLNEGRKYTPLGRAKSVGIGISIRSRITNILSTRRSTLPFNPNELTLLAAVVPM